MEETEYKRELARIIENEINISANELKSLKEYIHKNFDLRYPVRDRNSRNTVVSVVVLIVSIIGVLVGFSDLYLFEKSKQDLFLVSFIILLITIVSGFVLYFILTWRINSIESKIGKWQASCDQMITNHYFLLGIISPMTFDINNVSLYHIYMFHEFAKLVMGSRDQMYVAMINLSRSRISRNDKETLIRTSEVLLRIMAYRFLKYKFMEKEINELFGFQPGLINPLIIRFEGKIQKSSRHFVYSLLKFRNSIIKMIFDKYRLLRINFKLIPQKRKQIQMRINAFVLRRMGRK